jgi:hypothetical protein
VSESVRGPVAPVVLGDDETPEIEGGFSRRTLRWIVGTAVVSFVAAVLLGVYGHDLERRPTLDANTFSYSALGYHGLFDFLRAMGLGVVARQAPAGGVAAAKPLILAEPDGRDPARLKALYEEAGKRHASLVVVLPKWTPGAPRKKHPDWLATVTLVAPVEIQRVLGELGEEKLREVGIARSGGPLRCTARWGASPVEIEIDSDTVQLLAPSPALEPVVACAGGLLIARRAGGAPRTFLIADPDLLNNQGLGRAGNAEAVYRFLVHDLAATGIVFDETIHGFDRVPGLLAESLRFPMVLGVIQSLLLLGVVLWAGMGRFGKPLPAAAGLAAGKEILIDNTAKLLASGGHAEDSLLRYFRQATRAVANHYFLSPDLTDGERLAKLQRLTDGHGLQLSLAALELRIAGLPAGKRGEETAAGLARRLHDWRLLMTKNR